MAAFPDGAGSGGVPVRVGFGRCRRRLAVTDLLSARAAPVPPPFPRRFWSLSGLGVRRVAVLGCTVEEYRGVLAAVSGTAGVSSLRRRSPDPNTDQCCLRHDGRQAAQRARPRIAPSYPSGRPLRSASSPRWNPPWPTQSAVLRVSCGGAPTCPTRKTWRCGAPRPGC